MDSPSFFEVFSALSSPWGMALWGLMVGSFLNVVIYRWPAMWRQDAFLSAMDSGLLFGPPPPALTLSWPRSRCGHCHTALWNRDNIPVFSWLLLRAQCRFCQAPISLRYPLIEATNAGLWVIAALWTSNPWSTWQLSIAFSLALVISMIDWDTYHLPMPPMLAFGVFGLWLLPATLFLHEVLVGSGLGFLLFQIVASVGHRLKGYSVMGEGDAYWLAALLLWTGPFSLPALLILSGFWGLVLTIIARHRTTSDPSIPCGAVPFGPALTLAWFSYLAWTHGMTGTAF